MNSAEERDFGFIVILVAENCRIDWWEVIGNERERLKRSDCKAESKFVLALGKFLGSVH